MATATLATPQTSLSSDIAVSLQGVNKWYGDFHVLKEIDLTVAKG